MQIPTIPPSHRSLCFDFDTCIVHSSFSHDSDRAMEYLLVDLGKDAADVLISGR
jgi:hypothetical protein